MNAEPVLSRIALAGCQTQTRRSPDWLRILRKTLREKSKARKRKSALRLENERALIEQIRRVLALPMHKHTHFLRVRHPMGGSHI
jgi:hypothetical protein